MLYKSTNITKSKHNSCEVIKKTTYRYLGNIIDQHVKLYTHIEILIVKTQKLNYNIALEKYLITQNVTYGLFFHDSIKLTLYDYSLGWFGNSCK